MSTFWKAALVLAIPFAWVAAALPQEKTHHHAEGTTIRLMLLRQKSVQKELEIPADLAAKIKTFTHEQAEAFRDAFEFAEAKRKAAFEQLDEKNKKFIADNLSAKQHTRLDQLYMQFTAPYQLTRAEAAKKLDLTEDQQKKFKELHAEYKKEMTTILFGAETEGRGAKYAKLRDQTLTKILGILNEKQEAKARELVGTPFKGEIEFEDNEPSKKKK
jgi:hypothetical protein